jgi:acyl-coenzyme A synthetase/AMP-(fatty) acid ligase
LDDQERFWFCGRVAHRVLTVQDVLYPIPCEAILNCDPAVKRAALVGIGIPGEQTPVFVVEPRGARKTWLGWRLPPRAELAQLRAKLLARAAAHPLTAKIHEILFHPNFPVDIRHNAKIFREKLAVWAAQRLARRQPK